MTSSKSKVNLHVANALIQCLINFRIGSNSEINGNIDGFTSKDGWIFKYNKSTNEFATAKPDGTIETLFRPKDGVNYWMLQIEKYK